MHDYTKYKEQTERMFELLSNKIPDIKPVNKYPVATFNLAFDRAFAKYKHNNKRLSKREADRIIGSAVKEFKSIYGPYANVSGCKIIGNHIRFRPNFGTAYKTPKGRIYACYVRSNENDNQFMALLSSHALERLEIRSFLIKKFKHLTALDIALFPCHVIDASNKYKIIMRQDGYFILEQLDKDTYIALTFLSYDMISSFTTRVERELKYVQECI